MSKVEIYQDNCLQACKVIRDFLQKILMLESNYRIEMVRESVVTMKSFVDSMKNIVNAFGYEKYHSKFDYIDQVNNKVSGKEAFCLYEEEFMAMLALIYDMADNIYNDRIGKKKKCICCEEQVYYWPLPEYYNAKDDAVQSISETLNSEEYICPSCGATDRDRLIIAYLKHIDIGEAQKRIRMLQVAPSKSIEHWLERNCNNIEYETADLYMDGVTHKIDIQDMHSIEDEAYDVVICSHVLEHVKDDRKALSELKRILAKDGKILFLVPVSLNMDHIDEEWGLSEEENWRRFGQGDHCRRYGKKGLVSRLKEAGFSVLECGKNELGQDVFNDNGLIDTSVLYVLTK